MDRGPRTGAWRGGLEQGRSTGGSGAKPGSLDSLQLKLVAKVLIQLEHELCGPHTTTPLNPHPLTKWQELRKKQYSSNTCTKIERVQLAGSPLWPVSCDIVLIFSLLLYD